MRLVDVARRFNRTACLDAYVGGAPFYAQVIPYDEVKRDAVTFERRVFSVDPTVSIPARRVVTAMGQNWILGQKSPDQFLGNDIRHGYVAQQAEALATLTTLGKVVNAQAGTQAYAGRAWVKNPAFTQQSSDLSVLYDVYLSSSEVVQEGEVISYAGELMVVRVLHPSEAGFNRVTAEALGPGAYNAGFVSSGTWDPITETFTGSNVAAAIVKVRWQALFEYGNANAPSFEAGDQQLVISSTAVTQPIGATITLSDSSKWKVQSATQLPDAAWLCRATRHG